ncbi:MAG: hypothetical protein ACLR5S_00055 [Ruminococcus sp.]
MLDKIMNCKTDMETAVIALLGNHENWFARAASVDACGTGSVTMTDKAGFEIPRSIFVHD